MSKVRYLKDIENKEIRRCIKEMLRRVGIKGKAAETFEFNDGWYKTHEWTEKDEKSFRGWLVKRWRTVPAAYKAIWHYKPTTEKVQAEVAWFNLMWGWTRKKVAE